MEANRVTVDENRLGVIYTGADCLGLPPRTVADHVLSPKWECGALSRLLLVDATGLVIIQVDAFSILGVRLQDPAAVMGAAAVIGEPFSCRNAMMSCDSVSILLREIDDSIRLVAAFSTVWKTGEIDA